VGACHVDFIECPNKECLMRGYWKVYNDLEKAKRIFESYDDAKTKVISNIAKKTESIINKDGIFNLQMT
jgi:hypothetical protein